MSVGSLDDWPDPDDVLDDDAPPVPASEFEGPPEFDEEPAGQRTTDNDEGVVRRELAPAPDEPELFYPDLGAFVTEYFLPVFRRLANGNNTVWCSEWFLHAEALIRLEALWRAWEHLRLDPATGMAVWLRDFLDPTLARLLDADGPFKHCHTGHKQRDPLVSAPIPPGLF